MSSSDTIHLKQCLSRLRAGDPGARQDLLAAASDRLTRLTRKMFRSSPRLRAFEETADVFQNAVIRLCRALESMTPPTLLDFFRLAALQIRRELIDLARHHASAPAAPVENTPEMVDGSPGPDVLAQWREFHEQITCLPEDERAVFDLLFYQGLTQAEASELLGVSTRTVQTRWRNARLVLHQRLRGSFPPL
jgi:RNA polymerase sigma-70 factor (ECF subfamily)